MLEKNDETTETKQRKEIGTGVGRLADKVTSELQSDAAKEWDRRLQEKVPGKSMSWGQGHSCHTAGRHRATRSASHGPE